MQSPNIVRLRTADPFARIPNALLADCRLSWKAKGILCYLLSKPENWVARVADIENHGSDGETVVRTALLELRSLGYAQLQRVTDLRGRITGTRLLVADSQKFTPSTDEVKIKEDPASVKNPSEGSLGLENHHLSNTEGTKTEKTSCGSETLPDLPDEDYRPPPATYPPESHKKAIELWCEAYKKKFGVPYVFDGGKDGRAVKELLQTGITPQDLVSLAEKAWSYSTGIHAGRSWNCVNLSKSLHALRHAWPSLVNEIHAAENFTGY